MIPVRLELQNFLSYGTSAPALDFNRFNVACLSGKNGQGKSALLDAMTWAVWGEARKSSGKRKPDDELIRIGSRHMEVTFTFDVEGARYRVQRSFNRSATGKTTSSDLEFQLYESGEDAFRPLTGSNQRETQSIIEDTIGLDYDTFINSAFLLQGRSDEFTKKSPSQRKEILVNILNLGRYEKLARMARDEWRDARDEQERHESDVERLQEALEDVPEWKERRATVQSQIEKQTERLEDLREEEKRLTEARADLDAKAREAESVEASIQSVDARIKEHGEEIASLDEKIQGAEEVLEQSEQITSDYERYEALQEERDRLDEQRDLHRGIEKQIDQKKSALKERRNELEKKLDRLKVERQSFQKSLQECTNKLSKRSVLQEKLEQAEAARERFQSMAEVRDERERIKEQMAEVEQHLVGLRKELRGELTSLRRQIQRGEAALEETSNLDEQIDALQEKVRKRKELQSELQEIEQEGRSVSERLKERSGELEARRTEREQQVEEMNRFREVEGGTCPTCGTELTGAHAREVEASLNQKIEALDDRISTLMSKIAEDKEQRNALRRRYKDTAETVCELESVPEKLATLHEQKRARAEQVRTLQGYRQQAAELERRIQEKDYGGEARKRKKRLRQRLRELEFDPKAFEKVQNEAAQVDRYRERLRELDELDGRKDELERKIQHHDREITSIREALDDGSAFGDLPDTIERLMSQLDDVGFDPERFNEVRKALQELKSASARMKDLVNAQQNRKDWVEQRERIRERIAAENEQREELQATLQELREALDGKSDLEDRQEEKAEEVSEAESTLNDMQKRLGMLDERLEQARKDRASLKTSRRKRDEARKQKRLYKHLKQAFSKHGIPSLIIEETLPEIEERANVLLDQLTDGKMHVRLETLKDKKTGGTKETLEIIITDEQGVPRPYETFSGGESFRVNFALRLALSQLLAERSGVRVRTLVIDEGFGTQDQEGIERLVESIQTVREDFAKILVITHLQQLKQAFPVRIEVEKDPVTGSTFEMIGG